MTPENYQRSRAACSSGAALVALVSKPFCLAPESTWRRLGPLLLFWLGLATVGMSAETTPTTQNAAGALEPFIFVGMYGGGAGGRTAPDQFLYLSLTNYAQEYTIADESITAYEAREANVQGVMDYMKEEAASLPKGFVRRGENLGVDQFIPTYIRITFRLHSGWTYDWADYEKRLSSNQIELIRLAKDALRTGQPLKEQTPAAYTAAYWLDERTAAEFKRDGLSHALGAESIPPKSPLLESLRRPFRLVPVDRDVNPFQPFRVSFRPGGDVLEFSYSGKNFQVRSYRMTTSK